MGISVIVKSESDGYDYWTRTEDQLPHPEGRRAYLHLILY